MKRVLELTRCYRFPAAHVLRCDDFDDAENLRIFGKCANPAGHGHNYGLEVSVGGAPDPASGEIVDRDFLDALVDQRVIGRFGHRLLNEDPAFRTRVPTAENIARFCFAELAGPIAQGSTARLVRVRLHETRKNSFVCEEDS